MSKSHTGPQATAGLGAITTDKAPARKSKAQAEQPEAENKGGRPQRWAKNDKGEFLNVQKYTVVLTPEQWADLFLEAGRAMREHKMTGLDRSAVLRVMLFKWMRGDFRLTADDYAEDLDK